MSCIAVLQNTAEWLPFTATDVGTGAARTGVLYTQVTVSYKKYGDTSFSLKTLTGPADFREIGLGVYEINFSGLELDTLGTFIYVVNSNGALPAPALNQFLQLAEVQSAAAYTPGTITLSTNILTGNLVDLAGAALAGEAVSARIISAPTILGNTPNLGGIGTGQISAITDSGGFFALEVVQNAVVDITIPVINWRRTLTVPANATDVLFDIP
jgi:hypothetical protein